MSSDPNGMIDSPFARNGLVQGARQAQIGLMEIVSTRPLSPDAIHKALQQFNATITRSIVDDLKLDVGITLSQYAVDTRFNILKRMVIGCDDDCNERKCIYGKRLGHKKLKKI